MGKGAEKIKGRGFFSVSDNQQPSSNSTNQVGLDLPYTGNIYKA